MPAASRITLSLSGDHNQVTAAEIDITPGRAVYLCNGGIEGNSEDGVFAGWKDIPPELQEELVAAHSRLKCTLEEMVGDLMTKIKECQKHAVRAA